MNNTRPTLPAGTISFIWLIAFLHLIGDVTTSDYCASGRIYFGNINEYFYNYFQLNGVYLQKENIINGEPVFEHETHSIRLYFRPQTKKSKRGRWIFGSTSMPVILYASVKQRQLPLNSDIWEADSDGDGITIPRARLTCVARDFVTCSTQSLMLIGLPVALENIHGHRMGQYRMLPEVHRLRPVYFHQVTGEFLYYDILHGQGLWVISKHIGQGEEIVAFARDDAFRPEMILNTWSVITPMGLIENNKLSFICEGEPIDTADNGDEDCGDEICENGGDCIVTHQRRICNCKGLYWGLHCELEVPQCPSLSDVYNDNLLLTTTGRNLFDVGFVKCLNEEQEHGSIICTLQGKWSHLTNCFTDSINSISPFINR